MKACTTARAAAPSAPASPGVAFVTWERSQRPSIIAAIIVAWSATHASGTRPRRPWRRLVIIRRW